MRIRYLFILVVLHVGFVFWFSFGGCRENTDTSVYIFVGLGNHEMFVALQNDVPIMES
jgi:hypothetical protein